VVEILSVEDRDLPAQLRNLKSTRFWWKDDAISPAPRKLTPEITPREYSMKVDDFAERLANRLRELRAEVAGMAAERRLERKIKRTVLLAQTTEDLEESRDKLRRHFEAYFDRVIPEGEYPQNAASFMQAFESDLREADLFVQLLGNFAARRTADFPDGYAKYQYAAAARAKQMRDGTEKPLMLVQWRPSTLDPQEVTHRDKDLLRTPYVIAAGLEEFKREVLRLFEPIKPGKTEAPSQRRDFIFVNFAQVDQKIGNELLNICKKKRWLAFPPLFKGSAEEIDQELDDNLKDCSALILVYGEGPPRWVRA
jgi:hypothetical protein